MPVDWPSDLLDPCNPCWQLGKGGKQKKKGDEFAGVSDEDLQKMARDRSLPGKERRKAQTEEKARKLRGSTQKGK